MFASSNVSTFNAATLLAQVAATGLWIIAEILKGVFQTVNKDILFFFSWLAFYCIIKNFHFLMLRELISNYSAIKKRLNIVITK